MLYSCWKIGKIRLAGVIVLDHTVLKVVIKVHKSARYLSYN